MLAQSLISTSAVAKRSSSLLLPPQDIKPPEDSTTHFFPFPLSSEPEGEAVLSCTCTPQSLLLALASDCPYSLVHIPFSTILLSFSTSLFFPLQFLIQPLVFFSPSIPHLLFCLTALRWRLEPGIRIPGYLSLFARLSKTCPCIHSSHGLTRTRPKKERSTKRQGSNQKEKRRKRRRGKKQSGLLPNNANAKTPVSSLNIEHLPCTTRLFSYSPLKSLSPQINVGPVILSTIPQISTTPQQHNPNRSWYGCASRSFRRQFFGSFLE